MKRIILHPDQYAQGIERVYDYLLTQSTDKPIEVVIRKYVKPRTLEQNSKWHAMINDIARHTGNDAYEVKGYIKGRFGIKYSSGENIENFSNLIEFTYALGSEYGVHWSESYN